MAPSKHAAPTNQENDKQHHHHHHHRQERDQRPQPQSRSSFTSPSYLTYPVSHVVSGLYRRLTEPAPEPSVARPAADPMHSSAVFTPPRRHASPFQPPPLTPLTLNAPSNASNLLLTRSLAEEIRLLVPPRLQLVDNWQLVYSLDKDGSSLSTLYGKCEEFSHRSQRAGYLLVVKDSSSISSGVDEGGGGGGGGAVFGAYLTDPPHPASSYYGTGECFLWRASTLPATPIVQLGSTNGGHGNEGKGRNGGEQEDLLLPDLPPPPSGDTLNLPGRSTTFRSMSYPLYLAQKKKKKDEAKIFHG